MVTTCRKCGEMPVAMGIGGKVAYIDDCIADIVEALNTAGIATLDCCCGHGDNAGGIILADGRYLVVTDREHALRWCGEPYEKEAAW